MKSADLEDEYDRAVAAVDQRTLNRMRALGVSSAAVANINLSHPAFGVQRGEGQDDGSFRPGDGVPHVVIPVYEGGGLVDVVAWRSDDPGRWWLRTGLGWMLNADACFATRWDGCEVTLHATPLDWLRAGAVGIRYAGGVILDWDSPDLIQLRSFHAIACSDARLGSMLRGYFARPERRPIINIEEARFVA